MAEKEVKPDLASIVAENTDLEVQTIPRQGIVQMPDLWPRNGYHKTCFIHDCDSHTKYHTSTN